VAARWTGGAFPVRRGENDVRAVRAALDLIRRGAAVALFPEGTRHPDGLAQGLPGVGYLAARAGCPIVPAAVLGSEGLRGISGLAHHPSLLVRFGEPFTVASEARETGASVREIMERIAALLPPERRGIYAAFREPVHVS
jgi:1-acyl-sn-glycerol-3-phosphate acyltransferase